jgi:hypothetical protein
MKRMNNYVKEKKNEANKSNYIRRMGSHHKVYGPQNGTSPVYNSTITIEIQ